MELLKEIWPYMVTALAGLVGGGGIVAKYLEVSGQTKTALLLDRQKLTEEMHALWVKAIETENTLRKEQLEYERRIAKLEKEMVYFQSLSIEQQEEILKLEAAIKKGEVAYRELEKRWNDFTRVQE